MKKILIGLAAVIALGVTTGAGGCQDSKGTCHPGDTRASHGHTTVCNEDGKWAPMTHQVKP